MFKIFYPILNNSTFHKSQAFHPKIPNNLINQKSSQSIPPNKSIKINKHKTKTLSKIQINQINPYPNPSKPNQKKSSSKHQNPFTTINNLTINLLS